jgi:hypothetical protein
VIRSSDIPIRGRRKLVLGLAVVACVGAACGSGNPPSATNKQETGTPAQNALASSLNLQPGDLPDATWTKEPAGTGPNVVRDALNSCLLSASGSNTPAASAFSSNFLQQSSGQEIASQVQVFNSDSEAKKSAVNAAAASVGSCMSPEVNSGLAKTLSTTVTLQNVAVRSVPPTGTGPNGFAQETAAIVAFTNKEKQQTTTVYVEVVGFPSKTALVEAEFENTGAAPPKTLVKSTMTLLSKRAAAQ